MTQEDKKAAVRRTYEDCFNKGNINAVDEIVSEDFVTRTPHPGGFPPNREGFKQVVSVIREGFPDINFSVDDVIVENDKAVARVSATGTHKGRFMGIEPTNKQVKMTGIDIFRFDGGKVVERWGEFDIAGLLQQLGVVPSPN